MANSSFVSADYKTLYFKSALLLKARARYTTNKSNVLLQSFNETVVNHTLKRKERA
jgi:hypothetical protein